jgi:hypothetical protein
MLVNPTSRGLEVDTNVSEKDAALIFGVELVYSSETMVSPYKSARSYNAEHQHRHLHRRENLKSRQIKSILMP